MLDTYQITLRLILAAVAGGIIGFDRERHGRAAGLRTMLLASVAAAAAAILASENLSAAIPANWLPDPRVIQGVLSGIGFLGAGTILREGNAIRGVTTAATLWFVTIVGLLLGSGFLVIAGVTWVIGVFSLVCFPFFERLVPLENHMILSVTMVIDAIIETRIHDAVTACGAKIVGNTFERDIPSNTRTLHLTLRYNGREGRGIAPQLEAALASLPGITHISFQ